MKEIFMSEEIVLVARLKVRDDAIDATKGAALAIVEASRSEEGNINYDIHQALDDPTVFIWHETWKHKTAVDDHFATEFFQNFFATVEPLAAEPPQITLTRMISSK